MLIPLHGENGLGLSAVVDEADAPRVCAHRWYLWSGGYVATKVNVDGRRVTLALHQLIAGVDPAATPGKRAPHVDHINGDKLDNRRSNLRVGCTINRLNAKVCAGNTSGFTGVAFNAKANRWLAYWRVAGKNTVRRFKTKDEAVACRAEFNARMGLMNAGAA